MSGKLWAEGSLSVKNLDVVVVEPQMPAMAFEMRFAKVVVEKRVVFQACELELLRREVQRAL